MDDHGYRIGLCVEDPRIELHVLARAYRDAWLALNHCPPAGWHKLEGLGVMIEYRDPHARD